MTESGAAPSGNALTVVAVHGNGGGGERFGLMTDRMPCDVRLEECALG